MATEIKVPTLGESVTEATVAKWFKSEGDVVAVDEPILELETDKVTLEVNATAAGTIREITVKEGENVGVGALLGLIGRGSRDQAGGENAPQRPAEAIEKAASDDPVEAIENGKLSPAVRRLVDENNLDPTQITGTGKDGRLTKGDVLLFIKGSASAPSQAPQPTTIRTVAASEAGLKDPREERVKMTRLRQRIAERLKEAQNTAAMLTTFNEIDMTNVMSVRKKFQDDFEKRHGCRLGFMSFFVKACIVALKEIPAVNAEVDGDEIIYKNYYDIGVAVGTDQGLVVPVLRDADERSFADVEKGITVLGSRAREGRLGMDDLTGGTFTITNGGVYGSLMSTPIINPPQTGILGMHKIDRRPVAVGDSVEVRPMMYAALSYDHRIIDGREAVMFLVRVKECIEDPERILLAV
ncbi:MAG: 2-oxoglutarate dehydrogenase complex dihydrolipoyllysine-residue succinyltransferase [Pseudomonadota bacterium]|nr:2-oxoglutarate dehydrogenase complex dihydrolipoyllysine-residue succinyltransferase [Pseudomonadota bacterium]MEC8088017.1 2-oxoglutarate dehydrogenase complex dihydrolipoyllysine-residue succinyltransferase [Pseudomonadota bacterium]MEC8725626.1 2-oxoglutarate dehydrogenase complex dihydrolipoyllysine-residue succinyltransferase [Pseudomonadota bacterium]